jgi:hypothetical protein
MAARRPRESGADGGGRDGERVALSSGRDGLQWHRAVRAGAWCRSRRRTVNGRAGEAEGVRGETEGVSRAGRERPMAAVACAVAGSTGPPVVLPRVGGCAPTLRRRREQRHRQVVLVLMVFLAAAQMAQLAPTSKCSVEWQQEKEGGNVTRFLVQGDAMHMYVLSNTTRPDSIGT